MLSLKLFLKKVLWKFAAAIKSYFLHFCTDLWEGRTPAAECLSDVVTAQCIVLRSILTNKSFSKSTVRHTPLPAWDSWQNILYEKEWFRHEWIFSGRHNEISTWMEPACWLFQVDKTTIIVFFWKSRGTVIASYQRVNFYIPFSSLFVFQQLMSNACWTQTKSYKGLF